MFKWKKWISTLLIGTSLLAVPAGAIAASWTQTLLYGAATMVIVKQSLSKMDNGQQKQMLAATQSKTGVVEDGEYSQRLESIKANLEKTGQIKREYNVYANPSKDLNAFETIGGVISFNKGIMDVMDDSELAFVMSHEMMHGEKHHAIDGVMKGLAISTAVDVALNGKANALDILLGTLVVNYIDNEMVTMNQEKEADASGFEVFKKTDYNVGAAPASMVLVYEKYGDLFSEGWNRVISPNNHPQMTSRIQKLGNRVTKWSGNRVQVGGATVYLNALPVVTPAADGVYSSRRRAYLVAGNLARLCHNVYGEAGNDKDFAKKNVKLLSSGTETWNVGQNGNDVVVNDMRVITCTANDDGSAIVKSLDTALHAKAAKLPDKELVKQDTQWLKVNGYKEKKTTVKDKKAQDTNQTDKGSDQTSDKTDKTEAA